MAAIASALPCAEITTSIFASLAPVTSHEGRPILAEGAHPWRVAGRQVATPVHAAQAWVEGHVDAPCLEYRGVHLHVAVTDAVPSGDDDRYVHAERRIVVMVAEECTQVACGLAVLAGRARHWESEAFTLFRHESEHLTRLAADAATSVKLHVLLSHVRLALDEALDQAADA